MPSGGLQADIITAIPGFWQVTNLSWCKKTFPQSKCVLKSSKRNPYGKQDLFLPGKSGKSTELFHAPDGAAQKDEHIPGGLFKCSSGAEKAKSPVSVLQSPF